MLIININGRAQIKMHAQSQSPKEHFSGWCDSVAVRAYLPTDTEWLHTTVFQCCSKNHHSSQDLSTLGCVMKKLVKLLLHRGNRSSMREGTIALPLTSSDDTKGVCSVVEAVL